MAICLAAATVAARNPPTQPAMPPAHRTTRPNAARGPGPPRDQAARDPHATPPEVFPMCRKGTTRVGRGAAGSGGLPMRSTGTDRDQPKEHA